MLPTYMEEARIRPATRENLFTPMAYAKSPSTMPPSMAIASRRATGDASPLWGDQRPLESRKNVGTLYLFNPDGAETGPEATPRTIHRRYQNEESDSHREWPKTGIRHVEPSQHHERQGGLRILSDTRNRTQAAHVVGAAAAIASPGTPRTGIRTSYDATANRNMGDSTVRRVLDRNEELGAEADAAFSQKLDVKKPLVDHSINNAERFVMAVSDHVQRRNGGAATFYVALSRGLVAPTNAVPSSTSRPATTPNASALWLDPPKRRLTLSQCRDQLVALTGIAVSLADLAAVLWEMEGTGHLSDETLGNLEVAFNDFAAAFAVVPTSKRLSSHKI